MPGERDTELEKARSFLEQRDYKRALRCLDRARYTSDVAVLEQVSAMAHELAGVANEPKIAAGATYIADLLDAWERERPVTNPEALQAAYEAREAQNRQKRYKVLTQKDRFFAGKFDPEKLEAAVNAYADQGWRVIAMATASIPGGIVGNRDEIVVLMTREPDDAAA